eukprot:PhM_4_TR14411/c0_g1_i1/m.18424
MPSSSFINLSSSSSAHVPSAQTTTSLQEKLLLSKYRFGPLTTVVIFSLAQALNMRLCWWCGAQHTPSIAILGSTLVLTTVVVLYFVAIFAGAPRRSKSTTYGRGHLGPIIYRCYIMNLILLMFTAVPYARHAEEVTLVDDLLRPSSHLKIDNCTQLRSVAPPAFVPSSFSFVEMHIPRWWVEFEKEECIGDVCVAPVVCPEVLAEPTSSSFLYVVSSVPNCSAWTDFTSLRILQNPPRPLFMFMSSASATGVAASGSFGPRLDASLQLLRGAGGVAHNKVVVSMCLADTVATAQAAADSMAMMTFIYSVCSHVSVIVFNSVLAAVS